MKKNINITQLIKSNKQIINLFFLFWFILIITSFASENYYLSFKNTAFYFRFLTFSLVILYCLNNYKKLKYLIMYAYFFLITLIFLTSIYEFITGYNFFNNLPYANGRVSSIFLDEKILGSFISKSLPLVIALVYFNETKHKFLISLILIFISLILVILSGERTAFILFFIFIIFSLNIKDFRKVFFIILIFLLSLFIINPKIFNNEFTDRIILNTLSQVGFPSLGINERIRVFSPVHEHHYISGIKMFLKNPILGIGPNNFREECKKEKYFVKKIPFMEEKIYARSDGYFLYNKNSIATYHYFSIQNNTYERHAEEISISEKIYLDTETNKTDTKFFKNDYIFSYKSNLNIIGCNTHPHNYTVQFLSETGVVGFLFYFSLIGYCLYQIILIIFQKNYKLNAEYFMLVSIMISLFPLLPSGNFFNNMVSFNIFWNLPFYLFFLKKTSK